MSYLVNLDHETSYLVNLENFFDFQQKLSINHEKLKFSILIKYNFLLSKMKLSAIIYTKNSKILGWDGPDFDEH